MAEPTTLISAKSLLNLAGKLNKALTKRVKKRHDELIELQDTFGDIQQLAKYYVEPRGQSINPANEPEDGNDDSPNEPIFQILYKFFSKKTQLNESGSTHYFILADAGMGKTSLLAMLKLTHLFSFWNSMGIKYQCKLLKIGSDTLESIEKIKNKTQTVLLLDSLDEDPVCMKMDTDKRLIELLDASKKFHRVVITCRTQFFPEGKKTPFRKDQGKIQFGGFTCRLAYLSWFQDYQVDEYLRKRFPRTLKQRLLHQNNEEIIAKAKGILSKSDTLQFRPFLLSHIHDIIYEFGDKEKIKEYELYQTLVQIWLEREVKKLYAREIHVESEELRKACILVAEKMHLSKTSTISLPQLKVLFQSSSIIHGIEQVVEGISHIDVGGNSLLNKNSEGKFRFSHLTFKEFLLVDGVARKILSARQKPIATTDKMRSFIEQIDIPPFHFLSGKGAVHHPGITYSMKNIDKAYLVNANLEGSDFSDSSFKEANLSNANFKKAKLANTHFGEAVLNNANFELANIKGANLYRAELRGAYLRHQKLGECNINCARFGKANLVGTRFKNSATKNSSFIGALLDTSHIHDFTFEDCEFIDASLNYAKLKNTTFSQCSMEGAGFQNADLTSVNFVETELKKATFIKATLYYVYFKKSNLERCLFKNADLSSSNFEGVNLRHASFENCDLLTANFKHADLSDATFKNCKFNATDFRFANLSNASMENADLQLARLEGANFSQANLKHANLGKTSLHKAVLIRTNFKGATISHTDFQSQNLEGIILEDTTLNKANFKKANLRNASLTGAKIIRSNFSSADLSNANMQDTSLEYSFLDSVKMDNTSLEHSNLLAVSMKQANISSSNFERVVLDSAILDGASITKSDLKSCNLIDSSLKYTDLTDSSFEHANLERADLTEAILTECNLSHANLINATATGANFSRAILTNAALINTGKDGAIFTEAKMDNTIDSWEITSH